LKGQSPPPGAGLTSDKDAIMETNTIQLAHGGGGRLSRDLVERLIVPRFGSGPLAGLPDAALLLSCNRPLVFTTDSFVVQPLEFPGGNIGHLAVHGTVNDLAVCGAEPRWLSLALILEEGLSFALLEKVLDSVKAAADACGVAVVTGDTKVVARGQCDGLYVNTSGIGWQLEGYQLSPARIQAGDVVLASGTLGDHGLAVLACRENIHIANGPVSDTGSVHRLVAAAQEFAPGVRFMRDPTRGGVAAVLNEIVEGREFGIMLREEDLPFSAGGKAASEMLGIDPLHSACEGRLLMVAAPDAAPRILARWRALPEGAGATRIGEMVRAAPPGSTAGGVLGGRLALAGHVIMQTVTGGRRLVDWPRGELLPRIC
jgi:hydrogenase expression/formation protein HypE